MLRVELVDDPGRCQAPAKVTEMLRSGAGVFASGLRAEWDCWRRGGKATTNGRAMTAEERPGVQL